MLILHSCDHLTASQVTVCFVGVLCWACLGAIKVSPHSSKQVCICRRFRITLIFCVVLFDTQAKIAAALPLPFDRSGLVADLETTNICRNSDGACETNRPE